jgi:hypothetical protein
MCYREVCGTVSVWHPFGATRPLRSNTIKYCIALHEKGECVLLRPTTVLYCSCCQSFTENANRADRKSATSCGPKSQTFPDLFAMANGASGTSCQFFLAFPASDTAPRGRTLMVPHMHCASCTSCCARGGLKRRGKGGVLRCPRNTQNNHANSNCAVPYWTAGRAMSCRYAEHCQLI